MVLILLLGIVIGGMTVMFALENTSLVTVSIFADQVTAPLAAVILVSLLAGISITLLAMLPRFIRDAIDAYAQKRRQKMETAAQYTAAAVEQKIIV